jgi:hypothetical protein
MLHRLFFCCCFSILQTTQYIYTHYSDIFTIRAPDNFLVGGAISPYFLEIGVFLLKKKKKNYCTDCCLTASDKYCTYNMARKITAVHRLTCYSTQTFYLDSKTTSACSHSIKLSSYQRSSKYQFDSLWWLDPQSTAFYMSKLTITPKYCISSDTACSPNPCLNDGSCSISDSGEVICACNGDWTGLYCSGTCFM